MHAILSAIFLAFSFFLRIQATPLDDYVWKYDENYKWVDMVSFVEDLPRKFFFITDINFREMTTLAKENLWTEDIPLTYST